MNTAHREMLREMAASRLTLAGLVSDEERLRVEYQYVREYIKGTATLVIASELVNCSFKIIERYDGKGKNYAQTAITYEIESTGDLTDIIISLNDWNATSSISLTQAMHTVWNNSL